MPRPMTSVMLAAFMADVQRPAIFFEGQFVTGPLHVWTGIGTITWGGRTWTGIGTLGNITAIEEGTTVEAKGTVVTFSVFDATVLSDVLGEFQVNSPVAVYLGQFDATSNLIASPIPAFVGRMDQPKTRVEGQTGTITINLESKMLTMNNSRARRYTNADQQMRHPGDGAFRFVDSIRNRVSYWGRTANNHNI